MEIKVVLSPGDNPLDQIRESLEILYKIEKAFMKREEITVNFSKVSWILPCSAILISSKIIDIQKQGAKINYIESENEKVKEYLGGIGFPLGEKTDGNTYISIKHFANNTEDKNQVNKEANELLDKIDNKIPKQFGSSIKYILGELADNIGEHSHFTFASLMAQYYPKKEYLDIAVFDNGITIPLNFENNNFNFKKDSYAILAALSGKITTKKDEKMRAYGLRSCKDIAIKEINGELSIVSRKGIIILKKDKEPEFYDFEDIGLEGTFLYFRLKTPKKKVDIYSSLE